MFVIGIAIDGDLYTVHERGGSLLRILASLGSMGSGVIYWVAAWMGVHGDVTLDHVRARHGLHDHRRADEPSSRPRRVRHRGRAKGMSLLRNHIVLMFLYAVATGLFFALLWKETRAERIRFFLLVFCSLFLGGIALAWLMYPFPLQ